MNSSTFIPPTRVKVDKEKTFGKVSVWRCKEPHGKNKGEWSCVVTFTERHDYFELLKFDMARNTLILLTDEHDRQALGQLTQVDEKKLHIRGIGLPPKRYRRKVTTQLALYVIQNAEVIQRDRWTPLVTSSAGGSDPLI